jgi:hypothetical protein
LLSHRFFSFALVSYEINFGWLYFKPFLSPKPGQYLYQIRIYRKDVTLTSESINTEESIEEIIETLKKSLDVITQKINELIEVDKTLKG